MGPLIATGVFSAVALALAAEALSVLTTVHALQHAASINGWM